MLSTDTALYSNKVFVTDNVFYIGLHVRCKGLSTNKVVWPPSLTCNLTADLLFIKTIKVMRHWIVGCFIGV